MVTKCQLSVRLLCCAMIHIIIRLLNEAYYPVHLYEPDSAALARGINAVSLTLAANALQTPVTMAIVGRSLNIRVWDRSCMPRARGITASQLHTPGLFLGPNGFFQHKAQCACTMGGRSVGDAPDAFFYERNRFLIFKVRNQEVTLHLHNLSVTERTR